MRKLEAHKRNLRHSRARTRGWAGHEFHSGGCGWQQRFFGAWYEDGGCVQGWLCDLDSGDAPGQVYFTRDHPCPNCNAEKYLEGAREAYENAVLNEETDAPDADTFAARCLAFQLTRTGTLS